MWIKRIQYTIFLIDEILMYPSIKYRMVQKAVNFFAHDLSREKQGTIHTCLEMIKFGMANVLFNFQDLYYEYEVDKVDVEDKGIMIGGYESA